MNRFGILTGIGALALTSSLVACSKSGSSSPAGAAAGGAVDGTAVAPAYEVPITTMEGGACPDVASFFSRLRQLPDDAWTRRHTIALQPQSQNEDGSKARTNFLTVLAFSSFDFHERQMSSYRQEVETVEQSGCESLRFIDSEGNARAYLIREAGPAKIKLAQPETDLQPSEDSTAVKDSIVIEIDWLSATEMTIQTTYSAMDPCPDYKTLKVTRTERFRWGDAGLPEANAMEDVDASYVSRALKALAVAPQGFSTLDVETQAESNQMLKLSTTEMRKLKNSQVRTDLKLCPYRAKPPVGDEPPPPEDEAEPTPPSSGTETPAPAAS